MATEKDLINAVRDSLEADGQLARIKAEMRTEVIKLLNSSGHENKKDVKMPPDVLLINELIREYLEWMGYKYSSTVFVSECDLPKQSCERMLITASLGVKESENSKDVPLLCSMIETFKKMKNM